MDNMSRDQEIESEIISGKGKRKEKRGIETGCRETR
jgi:hypothetical protein